MGWFTWPEYCKLVYLILEFKIHVSISEKEIFFIKEIITWFKAAENSQVLDLERLQVSVLSSTVQQQMQEEVFSILVKSE